MPVCLRHNSSATTGSDKHYDMLCAGAANPGHLQMLASSSSLLGAAQSQVGLTNSHWFVTSLAAGTMVALELELSCCTIQMTARYTLAAVLCANPPRRTCCVLRTVPPALNDSEPAWYSIMCPELST